MSDFDYSYYVGAAYLIGAFILVGFGMVTVARYSQKKNRLKKFINEK